MARKLDPQIEDDFKKALDRLRAGCPQAKELAALHPSQLRINLVTVALEAGRSRTWISQENCDLPGVRKAVLAAQAEQREGRNTKSKPPTSSYILVRNLREDKRRLLEENRILTARLMDALTIARRALERTPGSSSSDAIASLRALAKKGGRLSRPASSASKRG